MKIEKPELIEQFYLQRASVSKDGMHVECLPANSGGELIDSNPVISFRENEERCIQIIFHGQESDTVIPLAVLKAAIEYAEKEVHSETYYDKSER